MSQQLGLHFFVRGKVQGVWFRASTKKEADKLGLTGWVRNLEDGRVEGMAFGPTTKLYQFRNWLNHGPEMAVVEELVCEELPIEEHPEFVVK